tara:strand:+ start:479 stop:799 length:321 start_codon:yes stop_codon:yes gene_type:complete
MAIESNNMRRQKRNNYRRANKVIQGCITVTSEECNGNAEKMVRRFTKKVKNDGIIDEFRERIRFRKPSDLRRQKKAATRKKIEKANRERETLFNPRERSRFSGRRR